MTDPNTARTEALINALRELDPHNTAELPSGPLDLANDDVLIELDLAADRLISATYAVLGDGDVDTAIPMNLRQRARTMPLLLMPRLAMKGGIWTQTLVHDLGGSVFVTETLTNAVAAAATYQLALHMRARPHVSLANVMTRVMASHSTPA